MGRWAGEWAGGWVGSQAGRRAGGQTEGQKVLSNDNCVNHHVYMLCIQYCVLCTYVEYTVLCTLCIIQYCTMGRCGGLLLAACIAQKVRCIFSVA